jgi:ribosomal protein L37E
LAFVSKIKCGNCGTFNTNKDYCENCGALINPKLKREKSDQKRIDDREEEDRNRVKGKFELFIERNRNHKNILIRLFFQLLYGIWFIVMAIGAFIAWLFAAVAA